MKINFQKRTQMEWINDLRDRQFEIIVTKVLTKAKSAMMNKVRISRGKNMGKYHINHRSEECNNGPKKFNGGTRLITV